MKDEKVTIGVWKQKATEFADKFLRGEDYDDSWTENPKGFGGVLKGNLLLHHELIPRRSSCRG